jgi:hypothetical protein
MPSAPIDTLFSEPAGRPQTLVMGAGALVLSSFVIYGYAFGDSGLTGSLVMAAGFALSGLAESLPADRRRAAGGLRISAIVLLLSLVAAVVLAPEYIV